MTTSEFQAGVTYDNAYLVFIDAAGYSTIVLTNPRDQAAQAFDMLREQALARIRGLSTSHRCARATLWKWAGDGGFFVVHDEDESIARNVALDAAMCLLTLDMPHLRDEFRLADLRGELHLRIAVHKGTIQPSRDGQNMSIHSPDINFAAHLEEATPSDSVAISADVYRTAGKYADSYRLVGLHEGKEVYLRLLSGNADAARAWLMARGLSNAVLVPAYPERPSQREKARLVDAASSEIIDLGTALGICSNYLVTTERPAWYRDAVIGFLERGGVYRCVLMDPSSEATSMLSRQMDEDLSAKIKKSIERFVRFKERNPAVASRLHVHQSDGYPGLAALAVDLDRPVSLILYSPYLSLMSPQRPGIERSDMPHYLVSPAAGQLFHNIRQLVLSFSATSTTQHIL